MQHRMKENKGAFGLNENRKMRTQVVFLRYAFLSVLICNKMITEAT